MKRQFVAGMALLLMAQTAPPARMADLAWMSGRWETQGASGRWTEESWSAPRGGMMIGYSRAGRGDGLREFEFLRIAAGEDGGLAYLAQPQGQAPVAFRLVRRDAASATFENGAHDYPQRIAYARSGDTLTATISAIDGSKARSWSYKRR